MKYDYEQKLRRWLEKTDKNGEVYRELFELSELARTGKSNETAESEIAAGKLEEAFYKDLEFGTGGLRGVLGAGTNRMNIYTVARAAQGIATYIKSKALAKSVAIAYDTRINSRLFAETAAGVYIANGIKVFMYDYVSTVPELSFATRKYHCGMGTIVTASHNPSKYNGYKVYCSDGYQITDETANEILACINAVDIFDDVKIMAFEEACSSEDFTFLSEETRDLFVEEAMKDMAFTGYGEDFSEKLAGLKAVYTPLNGAGNIPMRKMFERLGLKDVSIVKSQELPDGNFPTCPYPNPEKAEALALGLALAKENKADILIASDPDCDRVGIAVKRAAAESEYVLLTGNQTGILMFEYIASMRKKYANMPKSPVAIRSIVSSDTTDKIARAYGIDMKVTLTGFKYMGELITKLEKEGRREDFLFAFEESYGYLTRAHVRDKDGINAAMIICQMAAYYKAEGKTLIEVLSEIYTKYGYEENGLLNFEFEGIAGEQKMKDLMREFGEKPMQEVAGKALKKEIDYRKPESTGLPKTNALAYIYEDDISFTVRPSGTEPKLKIYTFAKASSKEEARAISEELKDVLRRNIEK